MKTTNLLPVVCLLALASACSKSEAKGPDVLGEAAQELDLSKLTPEGMQSKFTELTGEIAKQLQTVKDTASATNVRAALEPMVEQLSQLKAQIGSEMPSLDSISKAVDGIKTKFAGDESVMKILDPLLQKLQTLIG